METLVKILSIAVGGAFGAVARHLLNISPLAGLFRIFPFPTFFINITGSVLIGFAIIFFTDKFIVGDHWRLMLVVGFLGAFTTFSTFELETLELVRRKEIAAAALYVALSVGGGFIGVLGGVWLARKF